VADSPVAPEILEILFGEGVADFAMVGYLMDMPVESGHPAVFLAAMLKKIYAVVEVVNAGKLRIDAEYSAVVSNFTHINPDFCLLPVSCLFPSYLMSA